MLRTIKTKSDILSGSSSGGISVSAGGFNRKISELSCTQKPIKPPGSELSAPGASFWCFCGSKLPSRELLSLRHQSVLAVVEQRAGVGVYDFPQPHLLLEETEAFTVWSTEPQAEPTDSIKKPVRPTLGNIDSISPTHRTCDRYIR